MSKAERNYAGGRWTRAGYRQFIVGALRKAFLRYPVKQDVKKAASRPAVNRDGRTKFEYQCASCKGWFLGKEVQVDHVEECGDILADPGGYLGRMFCEEDGFQVLCIGCHRAKKKT